MVVFMQGIQKKKSKDRMREAKRNSESSSTDEVGQGELYCPAYALKVETGPQKKQHPPGKAKEKVGLIAMSKSMVWLRGLGPIILIHSTRYLDKSA